MSLTLATGASSFVGRQVVVRVIEAGCDIRVSPCVPAPRVRSEVNATDLFNDGLQIWRTVFDCMVGSLRWAVFASEPEAMRFECHAFEALPLERTA